MNILPIKRYAIASLFLLSVGLTTPSQAEDMKIPEIKTSRGKIYHNVQVRKVSPSEILIMHESGTARIPLEELPSDLKAKFGYDPVKAAAQKKLDDQKVAQTQAAYDKALAEAKLLKQKKAALEQKTSTPENEKTEDSGVLAKFFSVADNHTPSVTYDEKKHGLKVKDIFMGMSVSDCQEKLGALAEHPYRTIVALEDTQIFENALNNGAIIPDRIPISKGRMAVLPKRNEIGMFEKEEIIAFANPDGKIDLLAISGAYSKEIFKAKSLTIEEFVKNFNEGYGVELKPNFGAIPITYNVVTEQGVNIKIDQNFAVFIVQTDKPEDVKKSFD